MTHPRVAVVILAAGTSTRLGRPKQLLELGGKPLIRYTLENALGVAASDVVLVLGNRAEDIALVAGEGTFRTVVNPDFARGQSTSMAAGIAALSGDVDVAILMLGDQPTVGSELLNRLIDEFASSRAAIVQPRYRGKPGNPVLFRKDLFPELLKVSGDLGAREIIKARIGEIAYVEIDEDTPPDVDSDEDYERLKARWTSG